MLIEGDDVLPQLRSEWISDFNPAHVEVRTPRKSSWRRFSVNGTEVFELVPR